MREPKTLIFFVPGIYGSELFKVNKKTRRVTKIFPPTLLEKILPRKKKSDLFASRFLPQDSTNDYYFFAGRILLDYAGVSIYRLFFEACTKQLSSSCEMIPFSYDWAHSSMTNIVHEFHNFIQHYVLSEHNANAKLIFIGHSLGGLIIRLLIESYYPFAAYISQVRACFFCGTPIFGQKYFVQLLTDLGKPNYADLCNIHFQPNTFFSISQQMALLKKNYANFFFLLRFDELKAMFEYIDKRRSPATSCLTSIIPPPDILRRIKALATINRRDTIQYLFIYNLNYTTIVPATLFSTDGKNSIRNFFSDGIVTCSPEDIYKLNNTYNVTQIRLYHKISHALMLNYDVLVDILIQEISKIHYKNVT